ncbi:hypothetical protein LSTR_LSTR003005 [Laodelphax striatellus]|uniref:Uncharacterized protein n=1 Tax=Laodelphax striatellus TaxID=195883 RepID=A0A482XU30_LAOST|nr:hypothetical protein LSTR_LSTR003005 [Laodelphax striatellus]
MELLPNFGVLVWLFCAVVYIYRTISGRVERRRPYYRQNSEGPGSLFELQPKSVIQQPYHTSKKHSKQNYLIVFKGLKHFVADVFQKNNSDLFVDNRCLITGDKKEQLRFPFIKWTVTKECLAVEKNCVFCSIAWLNRDLKARPVLPAVDRPGKMTVYPFERKSLDQRKASLAPLKVDMKNNTSRWPLAVEKIAVSQEFKKVISVKKFTKKTLLAGDQVEVEFLVNKDMLPYGAYGVPINVFYQNASEPEIQEIQIPLKLMIVSPAYNGNSRMKAKQILPTEEEVDEEEVVAKRIEGVKYMPYFDKPKAIETFAEREKRAFAAIHYQHH